LFKVIRIACVLLSIPATALAEPAEDWKSCRGSDADAGIPACTRLIDNSSLSQKERADAYVERGAFLDTKDPLRAIADYDKAIALDPTSVNAYNHRAIVYLKQDNYDRAIADRAKAIELNPQLAASYAGRGFPLFKKGEFDAAIADYTKAIELNADYMWAYFYRAEAIKAKGDAGRAANDYLKAAELVSLGGSDEEAPLLQIVGRLIELGRIEDTIQPISRITDRDTLMTLRVMRTYEKLWSSPRVVAALGLELQQQRAIARSKLSAEQSPRNLDLKRRAMVALSNNGRYADAEIVGNQSLATLAAFDGAPDQEPWLRGELARALLRQGKFDKAQNVMKPVLAGLKTTKDLGPSLNYGDELVRVGRYREAIDVARKVELRGAAPYSATVMRWIQVCSEIGLGHRRQAEAVVARVLKASDNSLNNTVASLVCAGQDDKAAAILTRLIRQSPGRLIDFQGCGEGPTLQPFEREDQRRVLGILDLPGVRAVIEPIGRVRQSC
jgi:tetratricopeptide (TPR) repeat protein